ncbi:MAG: hypothetical protein AABW79_03070 [Nanoarchaeota archaeon]
MSFKEFIRELDGERIEGELVRTFLYSIILSAITFGIIYFLFLSQYIDLQKSGLYVILTLLSIAFIVPVAKQVRTYNALTCMGGMMVGMTIGMISGFLIGFYIGATNGMFIGSLAGMITGIFLGTWLGSCCGIMGFLEGIMAGFMGGLMGAMSAVMMINDYLEVASIIVFIVSAIILIGLKYMIYIETKPLKRDRKLSSWLTILLSIAFTIFISLVIAFAPKSLLVQ